MTLEYYHRKFGIMDAGLIKERLHLRIEQADERLLKVLAEMTESLFKSYQPDALEQAESSLQETYAQHLRPRTREEMTKEIEAAMADYERGDYLTLEESSKEASSW